MNLKPEEISSVIKEQIKRYASQLEVADGGISHSLENQG